MHTYRQSFAKRLPRAFTLVELLVVIAIIGVLVALLLPAIQSAREAARRNSCKNNLKQWALGCLTHESSVGYFPTGGWGWKWVADADRGTGEDQPGSWAYSVLPFIEQNALHQLPTDGQRDVITAAQRNGALRLQSTAINIINCPSRRSGAQAATFSDHSFNASANSPTSAPMVSSANHTQPYSNEQLGRSDYVGNGGTTNDFNTEGPGSSFERIIAGQGKWVTIGNLGQLVADNTRQITGVMFQRSLVGIRNIEDGTTNTYLIGEKFLQPKHYESGRGNHDGDWVEGSSTGNIRSAAVAPTQDRDFAIDTNEPVSFGSAHATSFHMSYCDGHVGSVSYDVDLTVHQINAGRSDGLSASN